MFKVFLKCRVFFIKNTRMIFLNFVINIFKIAVSVIIILTAIKKIILKNI